MKLVRATKAREAIADISPTRAPDGFPTHRWNQSMNEGRRENKELAWYRGHHAGLYDAYLTIKAEHPRVAEKFRKAAGLTEEGLLHGG